MELLLTKLTSYLQSVIGVSLSPKKWEGTLPHFLQHAYRFYTANLFSTQVILALDDGHDEQTPAVIRKHFDLFRAATEEDVEIVYVREQLRAFNRKRLLEFKVPFIIPGNQMCLAFTGIDFREQFRRMRSKPKQLSPSAQVVLIQLLLAPQQAGLTPKAASMALGYTPMSMTRAFDELEAIEVAIVEHRGRERWLRLQHSPKESWTTAFPYLRTPVAKRLFIQDCAAIGKLPKAGLLALSEYSMLAPPKQRTVAIGQAEWKAMRPKLDVTQIPPQDPLAVEIEIWRYAPSRYMNGHTVDPLSLYLSQKETEDERVVASLEELLAETL